MASNQTCCEVRVGQSQAANGARSTSGRIRIAAGALGLIAWWLLYRQLPVLADWVTYPLIGLARGTHLGSAVEFFLFEVPKVLMLLTLVVFGVGIIRSFFTPQRTRAILAGKRESAGNVLGALLGVVTPFCSCSAVHWICHYGRPTRRDLLVSHFGAHGERGCPRPPVRAFRLASGGTLRRNRAVYCDCGRLGDRPLAP